jgi:hypothetical protein
LFINGVVQADLIVTLDGKLDWKNKELEKVVALSSKDRQFMDYIIDQVSLNQRQGVESSFAGSDTWIRNMFRLYTKCFLSTEVNSEFGTGNTKNISYFNEKYRMAWAATSNYQKWYKCVSPEIGEETLAFHPGYDTKTLFPSSKSSSLTNYFSKKHNLLLADSDDLDDLPELRSSQSFKNLAEALDPNNNEKKLIRGKSINNVFGTGSLQNSANNTKSPKLTKTNSKKFKSSFTFRESSQSPIRTRTTVERVTFQNKSSHSEDNLRDFGALSKTPKSSFREDHMVPRPPRSSPGSVSFYHNHHLSFSELYMEDPSNSSTSEKDTNCKN